METNKMIENNQKVYLKVILNIEVDCPITWTKEKVKDHYEENYCIYNLLHQVVKDFKYQEKTGICKICNYGDIVIDYSGDYH